MAFLKPTRDPGQSITAVIGIHEECKSPAFFSHTCGVFVCDECGEHDGLVRCFCGWSAGGGNGRLELLEMGEILEEC